MPVAWGCVWTASSLRAPDPPATLDELAPQTGAPVLAPIEAFGGMRGGVVRLTLSGGPGVEVHSEGPPGLRGIVFEGPVPGFAHEPFRFGAVSFAYS